VNSQGEFLGRLADYLNTSGIAFMISGSVASSIHGQPRATNDIDVIIDATPESLNRFLKSIQGEWYVSVPAAAQAMRDRTMFNVIDAEKGWKADLIVRKDRPFSATEFSRREIAEVLGSRVPVVTVEDSILSKLEWSRESDSESQYKDALSVACLNRTNLDRAYLRNWAAQLGVDESLEKLLAELDRVSK